MNSIRDIAEAMPMRNALVELQQACDSLATSWISSDVLSNVLTTVSINAASSSPSTSLKRKRNTLESDRPAGSSQLSAIVIDESAQQTKPLSYKGLRHAPIEIEPEQPSDKQPRVTEAKLTTQSTTPERVPVAASVIDRPDSDEPGSLISDTSTYSDISISTASSTGDSPSRVAGETKRAHKVSSGALHISPPEKVDSTSETVQTSLLQPDTSKHANVKPASLSTCATCGAHFGVIDATSQKTTDRAAPDSEGSLLDLHASSIEAHRARYRILMSTGRLRSDSEEPSVSALHKDIFWSCHIRTTFRDIIVIPDDDIEASLEQDLYVQLFERVIDDAKKLNPKHRADPEFSEMLQLFDFVSGMRTEFAASHAAYQRDDDLHSRIEDELEALTTEMHTAHVDSLPVATEKTLRDVDIGNMRVDLLQPLIAASAAVSLGSPNPMPADADYIRVNAADASELFATRLPDRPLVILPDTAISGRAEDLQKQSFLSRLRAATEHREVENQHTQALAGKSNDESAPVDMTALVPAKIVLDQFEKGQRLPMTRERHPYNLLSLSGEMVPRSAPNVLHNSQHCLLQDAVRHIKNEQFSKIGMQLTPVAKAAHEYVPILSNAKQRKSAIVRDRLIDLESSLTFALLGERGALSAWHMDILNGTTVTCQFGIKIWFMVFKPRDEDIEQFKKYGELWQPPEDKYKVKYIPLFAGETLIMPPGLKAIHAPLTLTDCGMTGSMLWSRPTIAKTLENIAMLSENRNATNESVPGQLLDPGLRILRDMIAKDPADFGDPDMAAIDDYIARIKKAAKA